jgi:hypothetical protein
MPRRSSQGAFRRTHQVTSSPLGSSDKASVSSACDVTVTEQRRVFDGEGRPAVQCRLVVADREAADRVAIELARNHRIARPTESLLLVGLAELPLLGTDAVEPAIAHDAVILPGASAGSVARRCETRLLIGKPTGPVVVVPGTAEDRDGIHTITAEAFGRLRRAEEIARTSAVRAVILSGWSGPCAQGLSEAEQMMQAWSGTDVPIIFDEAARSTAENALCTAVIIGALGEVKDVIVVASWANAMRLRLVFHAALRTQGARPRLSIVWGRRHGASWRPGIVGLFRLRRHLLAGRAMLDCGR